MNAPLVPCIFLDRDGVLNRALVRNGKPYPPQTLGELEIISGVPAALRMLRDRGYLLIVVTNQPDVARGKQRREVVEAINARLLAELPLDRIYTSYEDGDSPRRKPNPGLLLEAAQDYGIDLPRSVMIGDRWKDIEAGRRAGCSFAVFIDYVYDEPAPNPAADFTTDSLSTATGWILGRTAAASHELHASTVELSECLAISGCNEKVLRSHERRERQENKARKSHPQITQIFTD